jgi:hypothetical protein
MAWARPPQTAIWRKDVLGATKTQIDIATLPAMQRNGVAKELIAALPQTNSVSPNDPSSSCPSARQIEPLARTASPECNGHCQSRREARLTLHEISGLDGAHRRRSQRSPN